MSTTTENIKEVVKEKYGEAARRVKTGGSTCCGASACCGTDVDPITSNLYDETQKGSVPKKRCWHRLAAEIRQRLRS